MIQTAWQQQQQQQQQQQHQQQQQQQQQQQHHCPVVAQNEDMCEFGNAKVRPHNFIFEVPDFITKYESKETYEEKYPESLNFKVPDYYVTLKFEEVEVPEKRLSKQKKKSYSYGKKKKWINSKTFGNRSKIII
jgi:type II secretory pathway pseudopilin PulG